MRIFSLLILLSAALLATGCGQQKTAGQGPPLDTGGGGAIPPDREEAENPQYKTWARFPKGTVAVERTITETEGNDAKTVTTVTYKLLEVTPEHVELESQASTRRYDGHESNNPPNTYTVPRLLRLPPGMKKDDFGKPKGSEQGEETVTVAGRAYKAKWYKGTDRNEAGEVFVQTWTSDDMPGGLVKSVTRTPAVKKLSTIEVIEIRIP